MTVAECYEAFGGDYEGVLSRLLKDERIAKYLKMFAGGNDLELLETALGEEKYEDAFRNVHNIKGVSANLGLTPLHAASDVLCEALRHGKPDFDVTPMLEDVKDAYDRILPMIALLG